MISRVAPFAAYLLFLAMAQSLDGLGTLFRWLSTWAPLGDLWLYPVKTAVVLVLLAYFWPCYNELNRPGQLRIQDGFLAISIGLLVYAAWVRMDWSWAVQGRSQGYDPYRAGDQYAPMLAGLRVFGASLVVPIMEEVFWRSFLLRYLISTQFESVRLGTFTPFSLVVSVALFGIEHDLWLAGMMAGAAYTMLLYWTGKLWPCVIAHAVTNLSLGLHVLHTHDWRWW